MYVRRVQWLPDSLTGWLHAVVHLHYPKIKGVIFWKVVNICPCPHVLLHHMMSAAADSCWQWIVLSTEYRKFFWMPCLDSYPHCCPTFQWQQGLSHIVCVTRHWQHLEKGSFTACPLDVSSFAHSMGTGWVQWFSFCNVDPVGYQPIFSLSLMRQNLDSFCGLWNKYELTHYKLPKSKESESRRITTILPHLRTTPEVSER